MGERRLQAFGLTVFLLVGVDHIGDGDAVDGHALDSAMRYANIREVDVFEGAAIEIGLLERNRRLLGRLAGFVGGGSNIEESGAAEIGSPDRGVVEIDIAQGGIAQIDVCESGA